MTVLFTKWGRSGDGATAMVSAWAEGADDWAYS